MNRILDSVAKRAFQQGFEVGVKRMAEAVEKELAPLARDREQDAFNRGWNQGGEEERKRALTVTANRHKATVPPGGDCTSARPSVACAASEPTSSTHTNRVKAGLAAAIARFQARAERRERKPRGRG